MRRVAFGITSFENMSWRSFYLVMISLCLGLLSMGAEFAHAAPLHHAGALVKFQTDPRIYVVADDFGALNLIPSQQIFRARGYSMKAVSQLPDGEFQNYYVRGELPSGPLVFVRDAGRVVADAGSTEPWSAASITKLMTALVLVDLIDDWDAPVTLAKKDELGGARLRVAVGGVYSRIDLLHASLMGSANNATHALARTSGVTMAQFVRRMNDKAEYLGMTNSHFVDPTGLDPRNVSTARDIALLIDTAQRSEHLAQIGKKKEYTLSSIGRKPREHRIITTNALLRGGDAVSLGKTGFLYESRYNFVVKADGDEGTDSRTIVVLNCPTKQSAYDVARKYVVEQRLDSAVALQ